MLGDLITVELMAAHVGKKAKLGLCPGDYTYLSFHSFLPLGIAPFSQFVCFRFFLWTPDLYFFSNLFFKGHRSVFYTVV